MAQMVRELALPPLAGVFRLVPDADRPPTLDKWIRSRRLRCVVWRRRSSTRYRGTDEAGVNYKHAVLTGRCNLGRTDKAE